MGRRRRPRGRNVTGILLLDKPLGITSNAALQEVKHLFKAQKAGHTGSLDPLATGLLPLCFGNATKISAFLLDADKRYRVRVRLGETTSTGDAEGEIIESHPANHITRDQVQDVLADFTGEISQLPPMYSAVKHNGQRLYKLARQGIEVEREARNITIYDLQLLNFDAPEFDLLVHCSKGTYVRTLAEDIGKALGVGAHVVALRRTLVGPFDEEGMVSMETLQQVSEEKGLHGLDQLLLSMDTGLNHWPAVHLGADSSFYIKQGQPVQVPKAPTEGYVRIYGADEHFIGVGEIDDDGRVAPRRLLANSN
ncbi:MAG TPA: tRNA pseudouridine(55) synthase TruB [Thiolapillus brandeum]|uniref:tRNA pseudouridine synthase B n=1 Tax=Thiolapillus brandeum TaxID=1076588 RepID=A0A831WE26_9GAMM|nr:tRNA pseudouridine(55) synthase TruB [Thiolapillus brandeum]